jgi:SAM-dependent methyltransferase
MSKWPKQFPPLSPEDQRICDDFMEHWHDVFPNRYSIADRFSQEYVVKNRPAKFSRTLEIGAGLGEHLHYEKLTEEQEREYVALDMRENMAQRIRQAWPKIQTCVGDCQQRLNYPDGHFDRIIAVHVLEHLPNLPAAIREMYRLCDKKTGTFSIVIPCEGSMAYGLARRISAKPIFEKRYKRPYHIFISREHINLPWEVLGEIEAYFEMTRRTYFPIPAPFEFCNLFIGAIFKPRPVPSPQP